MNATVTKRCVYGKTYRYDGPRGFGLVKYTGFHHPTGCDWLVQVGSYQRVGSRGPLKKTSRPRSPRWRKVGTGFYPTQEEAEKPLLELIA